MHHIHGKPFMMRDMNETGAHLLGNRVKLPLGVFGFHISPYGSSTRSHWSYKYYNI